MSELSVEELPKEVVAAWEKEPRIDLHHYPIEAFIRDKMLVLQGMTENIIAKKVCVQLAHEVAGKVPVLDHLRVAAAGPRENGALRDDALNSLLQEPVFTRCIVKLREGEQEELVRDVPGEDDGIIELQVNAGTVTLSGHVYSLSHRRLAEVLMWWTLGCEAVDNRLRVVPAERETDDELSDAIRMVLEKDPFVHASQLSFKVSNHSVTLEGYVASEQEKMLAVLDTWYVPGVKEVIDHITAHG